MPLKLTDRRVTSLKAPDPSGRQVLHWDTELKGLAVLCSGVSNAKSFVVQRDVNGKGRRITIGATIELSVEEARDEAIPLIRDMRKGIDPKAKKEAEKDAVVTLRDALDAYLEARKTLRPATSKDYRWNVEQYFSKWLDEPLKSITPEKVEKRHQAIQREVAERALSKLVKGNSAANGAMRVLRILWNYARERTPDLPDNPVKRLRRAWYPEPRRQGVVKSSELPDFYEAVMDLPNPIHRDYLLLILFTGLRKQEAAALTWHDIDFAEKVIRIPAERTKANRRLDLPMSDYLFDLLVARRAIGLDGPHIFPAYSKSGHLEEPRFALDAIEEATEIKVTVHDLRRTFITVAESCDIPLYALKGLVNHSMGNDVTAGYIVAGPERLREPMQKVTDRLRGLIGLVEVEAQDVVSIR